MSEAITQFMNAVFGGNIPEPPLTMAQIAARATLVYVIGILIVRLGKSRLIARNTPLDVILGFILGSLLSRGITGHASITETLMASLVLVAVHWLITALAVRYHRFGNLFKGNFKVLVADGQVNERALNSSHISDNDLFESLRQHGYETLSQIDKAYKERSGDISIIPRSTAPRVVEVAVEAGVQTVRIELS